MTDMTERDHDRLLDAQQVREELERHFDRICEVSEMQRLTELVQVQRELITWLEKKMSYFVTMRYLTGLDKEQHEGFRKKIRELEGV